jgi:uncharacterized protein
MNNEPSTPSYDLLRGHQYMSLTTFRRSGEAMATPVWFAAVDGEGKTAKPDRLYVTTEGTSGKAKRLRNNPAVQAAPCTASGKLLGPAAEGKGRVLTADEETRAAKRALDRKYGLVGFLFGLLGSRRGAQRVFLEITLGQ